jgi:hypothetical protein
MTIGTNAGYTAVVGVACNSCGSEIKATSAYTQSYTAFKPNNVTLTSRTQINPYLPGVNDRIFDGYVLNDKFCDTDEAGLCKRDGGMNFFLINNLVNGFDLTSYGRVGLDFNPDRDAQIPSFASYLKQKGVIKQNLVTFSHDMYGAFQLTFGGYGNPDTVKDIEWFGYNRFNSLGFRAMNLTNITLSSIILGQGKIQSVVENNIPGLLYKVTKVNQIEDFRKSLSNVLNCVVSTSMQGPMVQNFIIKGLNRIQVEKKLGFLEISFDDGKQLNLNMSAFLEDAIGGK